VLGFVLPLLLLIAAAVAQVLEPWPVVTLRNAGFDAYQRRRPRSYQPAPVRIVDIDEESLARIGQWPWPRTRLAELVDRLRAKGAAVIAFDMVFAEPDRTSPEEAARAWNADAGLRQRLHELPSHDQVFAQAIARGKVVTSFVLRSAAGGRPPAQKAKFVIAGDDPKDVLPIFRGAANSLPEIESAAAGNGAVNFISAGDGVIRALPLVYRHGDTVLPAFALEAVRLTQGSDAYVLRGDASPAILEVRAGPLALQTDPQGQLWLHYGPSLPRRYIPAWRVLDPAGGIEDVSGMVLLVGTSAAGLKDLRFTPLGEGSTPGVEIHAQAIEQALQGTYLVRPVWAPLAELATLLALGLVLIVVSMRTSPLVSAVIAAALLGGLLVSSWIAFATFRVLLDALVPSVGLAAVFVTGSVYRHVRAERERRWIRKAFSSYISPNLVEHLISNPGELRLGGARRECSFVLTDLANFTTLVEQGDPETIVALLNEYLHEMIGIAFKHEGTVDRIVGDALVVMFSAPVEQPDHAARAVACAIEMDRFATRFSQTKQAEGVPVGITRIGVNSGMVTIGNVGGQSLFDYRALGDAINVAARLETVNRQLGTHVCVSKTTVAGCPAFVGRPVGVLVLKGKSEAVEAFEPLDTANGGSAAVTAYLAAYGLLERGDPSVREAFAAIADDPLAAFHLRRLDQGESGVTVVLQEK
jgi:adenylate cyclase